MLLVKSEVCNSFNFIPVLFSSKKLFLATRKKNPTQSVIPWPSVPHVSRKPPPVFNFISNYMTKNITKLYFLKTMPLGIQFSSERKIYIYFRSDGTGLRRTIKLPLFYFMVIVVLHIFIQFCNLTRKIHKSNTFYSFSQNILIGF